MNFFLELLRLKWFFASKTLGYTQDYIERTYQIYLNHTKIIHWREGHPVYSLTTPAVYSKPAANFFARQMYRSIQNKNLPNLMSFAINDICNASCDHCSFFSGVEDKQKQELSLDECQQAIKAALELGVSVINFVGGEPLLRKDFPEILKSVDKNLATTVLYTNGWLLEDQAIQLKQAGLDSVYISLDFADAARHDRFRHKKGLFEKAIQGIKKAKSVGFSTGISCCITPQQFHDGELDRIIELAKMIGVHEVMVFDALTTGRLKHRKDLVDNTAWVNEMIEHIGMYNGDPSYPGIILFAYMTSHRSVGCGCGTSYFYLSPYGDVMSCDFNHRIFGSIREKPLYQVWDDLTSSKGYECSKWGGCKIKSSNYLDNALVASSSSCCHNEK